MPFFNLELTLYFISNCLCFASICFCCGFLTKTENLKKKPENIPVDHQMIDHQMRHASFCGSPFLTFSYVILKVDVTRSHSRTHSPMTLTSLTSLTHPITSLAHVTHSLNHSLNHVTHSHSRTVTHAQSLTQIHSLTHARMHS